MPSKGDKLRAVQIIPVGGMGEVAAGADIGDAIILACRKQRLRIEDGDVVVVTHKIVSKAEGQVLRLDDVTPSKFSRRVGRHIGKDPRQVEVILSESRRIVKMVKSLIISESFHGYVCANAGVDQSNVERGRIVLLPKRPDFSARRIRETIRKKIRRNVAVIISDTFGRPWREGQVDVAIGISGLDPFADYRGSKDQYGYELKASVICVADELASAAELCMNKLDRVPVAIVRGYEFRRDEEANSKSLARKPSRDLFR